MSVKYVTMGLISKVDKGAYSNIVLNDAFREFFLSPKEKAFMTEIFYGVIRNKKFLDYIIERYTKDIRKEWIRNLLRISIYQITFMNSDDKGVVWEATELAKKYSIAISKFINGTLRNYLRNKDSELKRLDDEKNYEILYSIPKWFYDTLEKQYGNDNLKQAITSLKKIPYLSVRVNKLKYTEEKFEEFLKEKDIQIIKKVDTVYYVNSGLIINSEEFKTGKIIAQDASSYLAAKNLGAMPNELVLDICAAPGGKTAVLAEEMKNSGEVIAIDVHQHKIKLIDTNMKKLGIDIVKAIVMDAKNVNKQGRKFDKILVDVPCSGYGVIRKKPEILYSKNRENIEELAKLQLEILNSAADILKDGGELIYSTCTITDKENTNNIKKFLEERKEFKVEKLYIPENVSGDYDNLGGFCINYKEEIMDNFYIIKLKKGEKC
ncbi:16S rRNA (cytosine(967)-C(5))-methyltransferase RsmB [Fusobacterium polymorphum]|jgi:ribosomal RNA small subunit methyltransferase RsmB|uniref:16S rRNA (cytosine(967)-C(5))-methyltransferase n=1 Tax=Fusobacterium nucleatum CTI-6 TaxID=1316587 RepID=U7TR99_FUSNU|nr:MULTISPECIES: 16S rRNA (cytosine(967)-C(5))-methyltransferase RsmB [Fusobacterium]ERT46898.1 ribosomal RNA small subunit methyltransferase B [Fusobacterium nucleatum CTI-6]MBW9311113.1 16S rRNA (cytosine(967)-C(5))-methyltransferase RsmB [Fusobacterium nucleatum]BEO99333.1 16S rRNA (cytosine(967)-C(5))-methyltransferase RsmB [Fusobacterium nucleatum]BEP10733.1 16S rRNA (cytosine(967)-C(5))-methyltransferase RsmB [Fusobacterium nucleatum]